jgi:hypothetical protein
VPQLVDRRLDVETALRYGGEQVAQALFFDERSSDSS